MQSKHIVFDIETTGLKWHDGHVITCICAKDSDGEELKVSGEDEKGIIRAFLEFLRTRANHRLISANGKDFDVPFIVGRSPIHGIPAFDNVLLSRMDHFDLVNDVTRRKLALNDWASVYGFSPKTGDGLEAIRLFREREFEKLEEYCMDDVILTEKVYLKYNELRNNETTN